VSKHLANLQHLLVKLQTRYGDDDDMVREIAAQLTVLEELESRGKALRRARARAPAEIGSPGVRLAPMPEGPL
jgi:hypothetical protein